MLGSSKLTPNFKPYIIVFFSFLLSPTTSASLSLLCQPLFYNFQTNRSLHMQKLKACPLTPLCFYFFFSSSLALSFSFSFSHTLTLSHTHYRRKTKPKLKAMMLEMAVAEFKACFAQEKSFWREGAAWYTLKGAEFKFCFSVFFILFYFIRFRFKGK